MEGITLITLAALLALAIVFVKMAVVIIPQSETRIIERLVPGAGLVSFPGCGHYSFLDNPVQFAAVLNSFLQS